MRWRGSRRDLKTSKGMDLAWSSTPYCGPGAVPDSFWTSWNLDPILLAGLLLGLGVWRSIRGKSARADRQFAGAWLVLVIAFVSPLCALSAALFSARIVHHLLLVVLAAPLLALALREPLEAWRARPLAVVPLAAAHALVFWFWHAPAAYAVALSHHGLYWLMEISLLGSALLFWLAALDRRASVAVVLPTVTGVMSQMGLLGALLVFAGDALYAPHAGTTAPWGLSPLEDQQLAGLLMWVPGTLPYLALLLVGAVIHIRGGLSERQA